MKTKISFYAATLIILTLSISANASSLHCSWGTLSVTEQSQKLISPIHTMQMDILSSKASSMNVQFDITNHYDERIYPVFNGVWSKNNNSVQTNQSIAGFMLGNYELTSNDSKTISLSVNENGKIILIVDNNQYDKWTCEIPGDYQENYKGYIK